jgi:cytochrome c oxidase subunit 4
MATDTQHAEAHHGPDLKAYLVVFGALAIFTALSFGVNAVLGQNHVSAMIILGIGVCKATLVGMYFMHLKVDWPKVYFMIVPAFILGTMMMIVLLPDFVLAWKD